MAGLVWSCLAAFAIPSAAQTVIGSATLMCGSPLGSAGPIEGAIINQTATTITDLEIELSIIGVDDNGALERKRDVHFVVVPSLSQSGMVTKLEANGDAYFNIPGADYSDYTCPPKGDPGTVPNIAAIAITRINGKSTLAVAKHGKPPKQAPMSSMLQVPRSTDRAPAQHEMVEAILRKNALLKPAVIDKQRQECLSRGTWACAFTNDTNINVVFSQQ